MGAGTLGDEVTELSLDLGVGVEDANALASMLPGSQLTSLEYASQLRNSPPMR